MTRRMVGRNKGRDESKGMEKYITGEEEMIAKNLERIGKKMERINDIMMEQIVHIKKEWKEEKKDKEEKRRDKGCTLNPTLFNTYDGLEEEKKQNGGMIIGKEKFWIIMYVDDANDKRHRRCNVIGKERIRIERNAEKV